MSATLAAKVSHHFVESTNPNALFDERERAYLDAYLEREQPRFNSPGASCKTELFFGFFFDGTKNSYLESDTPRSDKADKFTHSNVVRLYDCFPGNSVPGVLPKTIDWSYKTAQYTHFFRVYVPGVARAFDQINDSGKGLLPAAFAAGGEARIAWALIQAINNLNRYFCKVPLIDNEEAAVLSRRIALNRAQLDVLRSERSAIRHPDGLRVRSELKTLLVRLHASLALHVTDKTAGRPAKIDPGIVTKINISIFGLRHGRSLIG